MIKRMAYELAEEDYKEIRFVCRLIDDRQRRSVYLKPGVGYFERPRKDFQRLDMFWIECYLGTEDLGPLSVDPLVGGDNTFVVSTNHNKVVGNSRLIKLAREWFLEQPQYLQQVEWMKVVRQQFEEDAGKEGDTFLGTEIPR